MKIVLVLALLATLLPAAESVEEKAPGLAIALISENQGIAPGQPFQVGLHLDHFPGFHTYWQNPGMVGMATSLDWDLPEGFSASEIRWPYPEKTFMAEYPCHGYEREVTLLVTITPPAEIDAQSVTLVADASWMCCAKGCYPGFQKLTLELPVTPDPKPAPEAKALIEEARKELPTTDHPVEAILRSKVDATEIEATFRLPEDWSREDPYFFSTDGQISSDQKQKFIRQPDGSLLLKIARSEFSPENKATLPGVLKIGSRHLALEATPPAR